MLACFFLPLMFLSIYIHFQQGENTVLFKIVIQKEQYNKTIFICSKEIKK